MTLDANALVKVLQPHTGMTDPKTGAPTPTPTLALTNYAKGYIAMLKAAKFAHVLPTGQGSASPGGPLQQGTLTGGKFLAVLDPVMFGIAVSGAPLTALPGLKLECSAIALYLMANVLISFKAGTVKGTSTATPTSPGILAAGLATGGTISGLSGGALAKAVTAVTLQKGPKQIEFYSALCTYTMTSALASYKTNQVTGTCTSSGQWTAGIATGGTLS